MNKNIVLLFLFNIAILQAETDISNYDFNNLKSNNQILLDSNLPKVTIDINKDTKYPAYFIITPFDANNKILPVAYIFDKSANLFKTYTNAKPFFDFKPTSNGVFSYFDILKSSGGYGEANVVTMDTSGSKISTYKVNNEYFADFHDFKYLPNGNKIFIAYENNYKDMSFVASDGNPNANYLDGIIQEQDANGKTIFQWRSGHKIDVTETYNPLNQATNSYIHINSLDLDLDGNIIISCRNISQIIKINRKTGEVMWRMGGKKNEFTFINEHEENKPFYFSFTHCARVLQNGHILLFDNGNQKQNGYSRALEYELDQTNKTAKLVWEFRHTPDISAPNQGSVQRLKNGNTLIGWGGATTSGTKIAATEVTSNGEVVFETSIPEGLSSYRVLKTDELSCPPALTIVDKEIGKGNTYQFKNSNKDTILTITVDKITGFTYNIMTFKKFDCNNITPYFEGVAPKIFNYRLQTTATGIDTIITEARLRLDLFSEVINKKNAKIYFRSASGVTFKELNTAFDASTNELVFNIDGLGDYLIGEPNLISNKPSVPFLQFPENNATLKLNTNSKFRWQTDGYATKHNIQISLDSAFTKIDFEMKDSNSSVINLPIDKISTQATFKAYWRVASGNDNGYSNWSSIYSFNYTNKPFIAITNVSNGDTITRKSRKILRWNSNIDDSLSLSLYRDDIELFKIKKAFYSFTNAIDWTVQDTLLSSSKYSFKLTPLNPINSTYAINSNKFTISDANTSVEFDTQNNIEFYPNPVENTINIKNIVLSNYLTFNISDLKGNIIKSFDSFTSNGNTISLDCSTLNSGVYILEINDSNRKTNIKFIKY